MLFYKVVFGCPNIDNIDFPNNGDFKKKNRASQPVKHK